MRSRTSFGFWLGDSSSQWEERREEEKKKTVPSVEVLDIMNMASFGELGIWNTKVSYAQKEWITGLQIFDAF